MMKFIVNFWEKRTDTYQQRSEVLSSQGHPLNEIK